MIAKTIKTKKLSDLFGYIFKLIFGININIPTHFAWLHHIYILACDWLQLLCGYIPNPGGLFVLHFCGDWLLRAGQLSLLVYATCKEKKIIGLQKKKKKKRKLILYHLCQNILLIQYLVPCIAILTGLKIEFVGPLTPFNIDWWDWKIWLQGKLRILVQHSVNHLPK